MAVAVALLVTLVGAGSVFADQPISSSPAGAIQIDWVGEEANQASYWEAYFADLGFDYTCEKVNVEGDFTTTIEYAAVVVKAGQYNFIWQPGPIGTYSTNPEVSHYFLCEGETPVEDDIIDPKGDILGPCADPAYYAIFDNTGSTVAIKFKFIWYNNLGKHVTTKTVPAGSMYTTWQHWVKPFTQMKVGYKDPTTGVWINLVKETSVKGVYPVCPYSPGFSTPTP